MLPAYKDCMETLYNTLKKAADQRAEPIEKTPTYFNCLPSTLDFQFGETNIAEIKIQKQTNVDFRAFP
jgi:hypothetical protein